MLCCCLVCARCSFAHSHSWLVSSPVLVCLMSCHLGLCCRVLASATTAIGEHYICGGTWVVSPALSYSSFCLVGIADGGKMRLLSLTVSTQCAPTPASLPRATHTGTMTLCLTPRIVGRAQGRCVFTLRYTTSPRPFASDGRRNVLCVNGRPPIRRRRYWRRFVCGHRF